MSKKAIKESLRRDLDALVRAGHKKAVAKRILNEVIAEVGSEYQIGMLVQYHADGLRAGYVADVPTAGQVKIQPIGPSGAEEPSTKYVKLENVVKIVPTPKENTMTAIAAKATSLKAAAETKLKAQAENLIKNLAAKVPGAKAAVTAKPAKAAKAPKATKAPAAPKTKRDGFTDEMAITVVAKENPGREGTKRFAWFALYAKTKTVGKYLAAGGDRGYLKFDAGKGFIKIK